MSGPIDDGGPAFPVDNRATRHSAYVGMSLRDCFAAKALNGIISACSDVGYHRATAEQAEKMSVKMTQFIAGMAYEYADAMIAERSKTK